MLVDGGGSNEPRWSWSEVAHRRPPAYAAISCGLHKHFGHPSPLTIARLQAHDVRTFVTAWNGAIVFVDDGTSIAAIPTHGK
jgi:beta-lactamase superfamily II metal-dependent hydrolase